MSGSVSVGQLVELHQTPQRIRNICVLGHVDHGKTTMSDSLIASNGLIHPKMVGKLRFLDSRDDEQLRCITMKSSSISLLYPRVETEAELMGGAHLINLIDSPGHIDFCSEVSTAVRLSDGGVVIVDAVEGVCIQTHAVLRQAYQEKVETCLVVNKIDRLVSELSLSPEEAYDRLRGIVVEVNGIMSLFRSEQYLSEADLMMAHASAVNDEKGAGAHPRDGGQEDEGPLEAPTQDEEDVFQPAKGNVVFASAIDAWGFRVQSFAHMYAAKLGASATVLQRALWGDYYYSPKLKKIVGRKAAAGKLKPMFVQLVLEPIWQMYAASGVYDYVNTSGPAPTKTLAEMVTALKVSVPPRDLNHADSRVQLQSVLRSWLSLPNAVLGMVVDHLPSPVAATPNRIARLMPQKALRAEPPADLERVYTSVRASSTSTEDEVVICVSKMISVMANTLPPEASARTGGGEVFLAFGRVFSGVVHPGQRLYVLSDAFDPSAPEEGGYQEVYISDLFLMMGRGLELMDSVAAGNVLAIGGLEKTILKSATLSSTLHCRPFGSMIFQATPIVQVALLPKSVSDLPLLVEGLRLLNQADAFVEVTMQTNGEHVLGAAGEVHLERCIKDLEERFAGVPLNVSPPLVAFKESVATRVKKDAHPPAAEATTPNGLCTLRVWALPIPGATTRVLQESEQLLRQIHSSAQAEVEELDAGVCSALRKRLERAAAQGEDQQQDSMEGEVASEQVDPLLCQAWAFGPRGCGPNILLSAGGSPSWHHPKEAEDGCGVAETRMLGRASAAMALRLSGNAEASGSIDTSAESHVQTEALWSTIEAAVHTGFQLATVSGPLCDEPMWGVALRAEATLCGTDPREEQFGPFSGQLISTTREACRAALLAAGARLVEAQYMCETSTSADWLGRTYAVLGRRRARVLREFMQEGSGMFTVLSYLPAADSFGLAEELRRETSGTTSAQVMLSHWERLVDDPFFVPTTEDEKEEFGEGADAVPQNLARRLVDKVRRRKGLLVQEKLVAAATKQRTIARKK